MTVGRSTEPSGCHRALSQYCCYHHKGLVFESWTELDQPPPQCPGKGTRLIWMTLVDDTQGHPRALLALHTLLPNAGTSGLQRRHVAAGSWTMACRLIWGGPYPVLPSVPVREEPQPHTQMHTQPQWEKPSVLCPRARTWGA